jgi:hypothetical protein
MANSPRNTFLGNLSKWEYDVPYATQWALQIQPDSSNSLLSDILQKYTKIDVDDSFYINSNVISKLLSDRVAGHQDGLGLHFAQTITVPQEGFTPGRAGIEDSGGYLKGVTGGDRMSVGEKTLTIDLLETNLDFIDGIIRPWVIAASYRGLISRSDEPSIKSTILITHYTKGKSRPVRKIHQFTGCVPFDVTGSTLDYESEKIIKRSVKWLYNHYTYSLHDGSTT